MSLFYFLNSWAGEWPWLDTLARFFYVGAVPLLATALAALLILSPRGGDNHSRRSIALAAVLALALCALTMAAVNGLASGLLGSDNLSPRPYMTRFVTMLVVEPNDNSFPSPEMMVAGVLATALLAALPMAGLGAWVGVLLLGLARIFCGSNYPADVVAGAILGGAWCALSLALLRVRLQLPARGGVRLVWRTRHQAVLSSGIAAGVLLVAFVAFVRAPRFAAHRHWPWNSPASAAPPVLQPPTGVMPEAAVSSETADMPGNSLLDSPVVRLDGHLPRAEKLLREALQTIPLTHDIIGVNVAAIRAGTTGYRCAAVRFAVKNSGANERKRVAETATLIARRCFHADSQLRNLDVLGVKRQKSSDGIFEEAVVFSASLQNQDLILKRGPSWLNWSGVDPGLWLRARSKLYFDPQVLPDTKGGGA